MFYSCSPASFSHAPLRASRGATAATVDIHCHVLTPEAAALVKDALDPAREPMLVFANEETRAVNRKQEETIRAQLTSVEARLEAMNKAGIDIQAISPAPQYYYWAEPELGREASRLVNNRIAEIVASHPDRFVGLGTVPLQAPALAIRELERCVGELGLPGVQIGTHVGAWNLDAPELFPFFTRAAELGAAVFVHPWDMIAPERMRKYWLPW
ncbi:MAG TPA: amidohydrolase family protein, partial [Polyangiaceae bacterium]|nr:amidohydrolase family protein [Polyangiaceae bacterium]